jgi:hypothetical protein
MPAAATTATTASDPRTKEYLVKLYPEVSYIRSSDELLPQLPKPSFRSNLSVKITKIQNFVAKRLNPGNGVIPPTGRGLNGEIISEEIEILYRGHIITKQADLMYLLQNFADDFELMQLASGGGAGGEVGHAAGGGATIDSIISLGYRRIPK